MAPTAKHSARVRISAQSYWHLLELAAKSGEPMQIVLDKAVDAYWHQKFWEEMDTAYAALQQDTDAWKAYQDELRSFEGTLMDGLAPSKG